MARRRRIFRRSRKSGSGAAGPDHESQAEEDSAAPVDAPPDTEEAREEPRGSDTEVLDRLGHAAPDGGGDDTQDRIRVAAEAAAQAAEERAHDEILALEQDVERARSEVEALRTRLQEAERGAADAEDLDERVREAEERGRREAEGRARAEIEERVAAATAAEHRALEERATQSADTTVIEIIERSDRRLQEIEAQAGAAAERVSAAEQQLAAETERLRAEADERVRRETETARREAEKPGREAEKRVATAVEQARKQTEERVRAEQQEHLRAETERLRLQAEERAQAWEAAAAAKAAEARSAAAEWLRSQTKALRREGGRDAEQRRAELERELQETKRHLEEARARATEAERGGANPTPREKLSLASASFEELRAVGMSVTQAQQLIEHRERSRFSSVEELGSLPDFSDDFVEQVKDRLTP
jgi:DNA uptake protein ComE-like DNA-binding protein